MLTVTQMLRKHGVVEKFVEFFGPGLRSLAVADRATIANMAPEYGATIGFFPVDEKTLEYLRLTGRSEEQIALVEAYSRAQGLFARRALARSRVQLEARARSRRRSCRAWPGRRARRTASRSRDVAARVRAARCRARRRQGRARRRGARAQGAACADGRDATSSRHGSVVIAAITSCTNTSNPSVLTAAGLLARNAVERGLAVKPWVKTSLAPGSRVVTDYLAHSGLLAVPREARLQRRRLRLHDLHREQRAAAAARCRDAITEGNLVAAAVLSGNRNFEGRISALVRANYLASPPLVVAYALAGRIDLDLTREPIGVDKRGQARACSPTSGRAPTRSRAPSRAR